MLRLQMPQLRLQELPTRPRVGRRTACGDDAITEHAVGQAEMTWPLITTLYPLHIDLPMPQLILCRTAIASCFGVPCDVPLYAAAPNDGCGRHCCGHARGRRGCVPHYDVDWRVRDGTKAFWMLFES